MAILWAFFGHISVYLGHMWGNFGSNYLRGWFLIDFVSTLPLPYLAYLAPDDPGGIAGSAGSMRMARAASAASPLETPS